MNTKEFLSHHLLYSHKKNRSDRERTYEFEFVSVISAGSDIPRHNGDI